MLDSILNDMIAATSKAIDWHIFAFVSKDELHKYRMLVEHKPNGTLYTLLPRLWRNARKPVCKPIFVSNPIVTFVE